MEPLLEDMGSLTYTGAHDPTFTLLGSYSLPLGS